MTPSPRPSTIIGPMAMPEATDALSEMQKQYPWTKSVDMNVIDSTAQGDPDKSGRKLEFYSKTESYNPKPGKPTVEIFDKSMSPADLMGEVLSHHLAKTDSKVAGFRSKIIKSMTPEQKAGIKGDYDNEMRQGLVDKGASFDQWLNKQGGDSFFRGYPTGQWDAKEYTPEQKAIYDKMQQYLNTKAAR